MRRLSEGASLKAAEDAKAATATADASDDKGDAGDGAGELLPGLNAAMSSRVSEDEDSTEESWDSN